MAKLLKFADPGDDQMGINHGPPTYIERYEDEDNTYTFRHYKAIEIVKGMHREQYYLPEEVWQVYNDLATDLAKEKMRPKGLWNKIKYIFN